MVESLDHSKSAETVQAEGESAEISIENLPMDIDQKDEIAEVLNAVTEEKEADSTELIDEEMPVLIKETVESPMPELVRETEDIYYQQAYIENFHEKILNLKCKVRVASEAEEEVQSDGIKAGKTDDNKESTEPVETSVGDDTEVTMAIHTEVDTASKDCEEEGNF